MYNPNYNAMKEKEKTTRPLFIIAREIRKDWEDVYFGAKPYLDAMETIVSVNDMYFMDPGWEIVARFLSNARNWKGETAKRIKAELKAMLK